MWVVASKHAMQDRSPLHTTLTLILLLATLYGVYFSAKASLASRLYYDTKYKHAAYESEAQQTGRPLLSPTEIDARAERILELYPFSYMTCQFAAEASYHNRHLDFYPLLETSRKWADRGLTLNPYHRSLTLRRVGIYEKLYDYESALKHMKAYTEWNYWDPFNHARLCILYAKLEDFDNAQAELKQTGLTQFYYPTLHELKRIRARYEDRKNSPYN